MRGETRRAASRKMGSGCGTAGAGQAYGTDPEQTVTYARAAHIRYKTAHKNLPGRKWPEAGN